MTPRDSAKIDRICRDLGIELLPWQREWLAAFLDPTVVVFTAGRRNGRATMQRVADAIVYRSPA
jgi:hypothetical protein